ncbi:MULTISPECIES: hypothetical protein [Clostridia]|uniref:hypothetical protein n=1 Tax=Clostridia TaxID=186801 RepID=UPI000E5D0AB3|nr:hypothetical protein [Eubacterium sp. AF22-9]RGS30543.1 hypothetical protein DWY02_08975 [Eubacterium sp. AF22-9]HAS05679.1 hypothetical protein [Eubacterium sp.]HCO36273.1 hypothetical protein [Eubacterium sp.]
MSDKEEDYLDKLLDSINEKEQADSQQEEPKSEWQQEIEDKDPEEIAREVREKIEAENADNEEQEAQKDAKAEEEVNKMLEDTPVEEAAGATITPADDDSELSDNDMERLMNMNLDDLIDDVKADTDSISIDDLLNQGDELKRAEAQAQAQALEEELAEKEKNDSQVNETEAGNEGAVSDIENRQDADNKEADNKEPEKKESVQVDESKIKPEKPKKDSFFKKIKKVFFDSLEDESPKEEAADNGNGENTSSEDKSADKPEADNGEPKDENEQIIEDVFGNKDTLDDSEAPKKGFFARFKYRLAQMKAKRIEEEKAEEEAERLDNEEKQKNKELKKAAATEKKEKKKQAAEQKKAAKPKKVKQPKPKKEKKPKEPPKPGDILKIKPLSLVMLVLFVAGVVVLISVLNSALYYNTNSSQAKTYYNNGEYDKAYSKLNGMKLNSNDKTLYEQASTIMYVKRQYDSYENYMSLNMKTEALDALIKGIDRYNTFRSTAQELGIDDKFKAEYQNIIDALQNTFKISEAQGISLADMSNSDFTNYYLKIKEYGKAVQ